MALENILVPIDGSEGSDRALDLAMELAATNPELQIDILYVVPIPPLTDEESQDLKHIIDLMKADGDKKLSDALDYIGDTAEQADVMCLAGVNPAAEIIKLAQEREYDLIVIGNRGLSGRKEYAGSVSYKVLHGAPTSVLIAK